MAKKELDGTTEEKIKEAAKKLFVKKGFAATKTRDIAQEAGINVALLNYYFRSKEKLFDLIMMENMAHFAEGIAAIVHNEQTDLVGKMEGIVGMYIDMFLRQPDMPLFILTEIRNDPQRILSLLQSKIDIRNTVLMHQIMEAVKSGKLMPVNPLHFLANIVGLTVFPFIGRPLLQHIGQMNNEEYETFVRERKKMIPIWIMASFEPS